MKKVSLIIIMSVWAIIGSRGIHAQQARLEITQCTPQKIDIDQLKMGTKQIVQIDGFGFRSGLIVHLYTVNQRITISEWRLISPDPANPGTYTIGKAEIPQSIQQGIWDARPQLYGQFGPLKVNALIVISKTAITITNIDPQSIPSDHHAKQTLVTVEGQGFESTAKVYIGGWKIDKMWVKSDPNQITFHPVFENGKRLFQGTYVLEVVNPNKERAETNFTIDFPTRPTPLHHGNVWLQIFFAVIIIIATFLMCWYFAPWYVDNARDGYGWTEGQFCSYTNALRILIVGTGITLLGIIVIPRVVIIEAGIYGILIGLYLTSITRKGWSIVEALSARAREQKPIYYYGLAFLGLVLIIHICAAIYVWIH